MRFTQWLLALEDEDGVLGRFQKVVYSDINNGCASSRFTFEDWNDHFLKKHPDSAKLLISMLVTCYEFFSLKLSYEASKKTVL